MNLYQKDELRKIVSQYNPDHDLGPDAPVHWQIERLASAVLARLEHVEQLENMVTDMHHGRSRRDY